MEKFAQHAGTHYQKNQCKTIRYNRTGAATVIGGVGFVDTSRTEAESTSIETACDNITAVSTTLIAKRPLLVVAAEAIADNAKGSWHEGEGVECQVLVDSNTDVLVDDWLKPVNGGDHLVKATAFSVDETGAGAAESLVPVYVRALEGRTANSEGLIRGMLYSNGVIL